jgi:hypothetical protein
VAVGSGELTSLETVNREETTRKKTTIERTCDSFKGTYLRTD